MPRTRFPARPGKKIDFKQWTSLLAVGTSINTDVITLGAALAFAVPATVLRVRGAVQAQFDSTQTVQDDAALTWGLAVVSSAAFAAGVGAVPTPAGDPEFPWLWWGTMFLHAESGDPDAAWGANTMRLDVDSKAMRKVKPGESLIWVMQSAVLVGSPLINIDFHQTRVLIGT